MKERTANAARVFAERTGIRPKRCRALTGSMKEFVSITLAEHTMKTLTQDGMTRAPRGGYEYKGVPIRFISDNCPWGNQPGVTLNIYWSALEDEGARQP